VELRWLDPDRPDRRDVDGAVAVLEAARAVDCPHQPVLTASAFAARLRHGWDGDPPLTAVHWDHCGGTVAGVLEVSLPHWDNTHLGQVAVTVDPGARRRGLGTRLFEASVERVRAAGRTLVYADCFDYPGPVAFLKAMGLDRAYEEVQRRQDLDSLDWARLDGAYAEAGRRAAGYQLIRLPGPTPPDLMPDVVRMTGAINDAPVDDLNIEDEVFSPERIRAFEAAQQAQGWRLRRLVARERGTGLLAGHTITAVQGEQPWHGCQHDTSVLREHRGHRLGLLLKIGMLRWLAEQEPQLRDLDTWNAAANTHMIEVNEALGYRVLACGIGWQRHL